MVFNGGTGTISEFGMAWGLARLYFGNHKPMVLFGRFGKKSLRLSKICSAEMRFTKLWKRLREPLRRLRLPREEMTK